MDKVFFYPADRATRLKNRSSVKKLVIYLFKNEKIPLNEVSYIFCSDDYLLAINKNYLNHNSLTDVITFPLSTDGGPVSGEIYLSVDRIKENAKTYDVLYENELLRVILHGALHLCGYNDKNSQERRKMRNKEDFYLKTTDVSREADI